MELRLNLVFYMRHLHCRSWSLSPVSTWELPEGNFTDISIQFLAVLHHTPYPWSTRLVGGDHSAVCGFSPAGRLHPAPNGDEDRWRRGNPFRMPQEQDRILIDSSEPKVCHALLGVLDSCSAFPQTPRDNNQNPKKTGGLKMRNSCYRA